MSNELTEKQLIFRRGVFGQYSIDGIKGQDGSGNPGWEITTCIQSVSDYHHYWVSEQELHSMSVHIPLDGSAQLGQIHGIVTDINLEEKKAVLNAIALWETSTPQHLD